MSAFEFADRHYTTARQKLADAVAGLELSETEVKFLRWIESWDDSTVLNLAGIINKARSAGPREE